MNFWSTGWRNIKKSLLKVHEDFFLRRSTKNVCKILGSTFETLLYELPERTHEEISGGILVMILGRVFEKDDARVAGGDHKNPWGFCI